MPNISVGTDFAWLVSAQEAVRAGRRFIEPEHLFVGVCKVGELAEAGEGGAAELPEEEAGLRAEAEAVATVFGMFQLVPAALRHEASRPAAGGSLQRAEDEHVSRSPASHAAFRRAAELAADAPAVTPLHLLAALLDDASSPTVALLEGRGVNVAALRAAALAAASAPPSAAPALEDVTSSLDATATVYAPAAGGTDAERRLALFYELPLQFGGETSLEALLKLVVERVRDAVPGAQRSALLVKDPRTGSLLLKARLPETGKTAVSKRLARRAMEQRTAVVWPPPPPAAAQPPSSVIEHNIESAMYAPLLWREEALGVLCVDNCQTCGAFEAEDLRLLQAVAHHAAMAVANLQLQADLQRQAEVLGNALRMFSPRIAEQLMRRRGPIRLGGDFREATILLSDLRGFTNLSATMRPDEVADMLEDYFEHLVPLVFKHEGTVDKFVGDAILAVFGSPNADERQQLHAVQAAVEMQAAVRAVNERRRTEGKPTAEAGIGIHWGEVVHGLIGTRERMEFTVIGDAVNRASRYCDGARGGEVLISPEVRQWVWEFVETEETTIPTKHEGALAAYRVDRVKAARE